MSVPSRRGRVVKEEAEEHNDERWMASYMDMVTVLMCLFLVLFAMSSIDAGKFEKLKDSLATGFGSENSDTVDTAEGIIVTPDLIDAVGADGDLEEPSDAEVARAELDNLKGIQKYVDANVAAKGLSPAVEYEITDRGLIIRLVGAETFFQGGSAVLTGTATSVLDAVGAVLVTVPNDVAVEGHADPNGLSGGSYETDWELSSARATQVVRFFVDRGQVAGARASAVGYGSARPVTADTSSAGKALNRRVEVVVVSDAPEAVRQLIPGLIADDLAGLTPSASAPETAPETQPKAPKSTPKSEVAPAGGH